MLIKPMHLNSMKRMHVHGMDASCALLAPRIMAMKRIMHVDTMKWMHVDGMDEGLCIMAVQLMDLAVSGDASVEEALGYGSSWPDCCQ
jgi:hypothetical protein